MRISKKNWDVFVEGLKEFERGLKPLRKVAEQENNDYLKAMVTAFDAMKLFAENMVDSEEDDPLYGCKWHEA